jgi:hypothetical protein
MSRSAPAAAVAAEAPRREATRLETSRRRCSRSCHPLPCRTSCWASCRCWISRGRCSPACPRIPQPDAGTSGTKSRGGAVRTFENALRQTCHIQDRAIELGRLQHTQVAGELALRDFEHQGLLKRSDFVALGHFVFERLVAGSAARQGECSAEDGTDDRQCLHAGWEVFRAMGDSIGGDAGASPTAPQPWPRYPMEQSKTNPGRPQKIVLSSREASTPPGLDGPPAPRLALGHGRRVCRVIDVDTLRC